MSLAQRALVVSFSASLWSARKLDKKASKEVADNHNSETSRAGNYNKKLIDVSAPSYQAVVKAVGVARDYFYTNTLPWAQEGCGLIAAPQYIPFSQEMRAKIALVSQAADAFEADYPRLRENAKKELNGLYRHDDYPDADEVREKFGCSIDVLPVPDARGFDTLQGIVDTEIEQMKAAVTEQVEAAQKAAMARLWERLYETVRHAADSLANPKKVFRDSLVGNMREMAELLPKLNITGDEDLARMGKEVAESIAVYDPEVLRDDALIRKEVAKQAAAIANQMKGFMQ
jgi:hypothetical protein